MGLKLKISEVQRAQIVFLYKEGYSERLITERRKRSKNVVENAIIKVKEMGILFGYQKECSTSYNEFRKQDTIRIA